MLRLSEESERSFADSFVNQTVLVLFESWENGVARGYSENFLSLSVESNNDLVGQILPVRIVAPGKGVLI